MIFDENCLQTILMKYCALFLRKSGKISQNLSSAAFVIGTLRVKEKNSLPPGTIFSFKRSHFNEKGGN